MKTNTMQQLYVEELKDLYSAEQQLVRALPKLIKFAKSPNLKAAVQAHLDETKVQIERLEKVGKELDEKLSGKTCKAMKGLLEELNEMAEETEAGELLDCALIACAQKVEHYEIGSYGTVIAWAKMLKLDSHVKVLSMTLEEESAADEKLSELAETQVNADALAVS